jgi:SPP1 family predicted phage head-tail adaptor
MLKRKINQYNDGVLKFGKYIEKYDGNEILLNEKEFIQEGKLFFSYKAIREQDRLKFDDTGYKVELKINTPYMNKIKSDHIVLLNNNLYSIRYIEPDYSKKNLYIFLSNYEDEMSTYISIYKENRISPIENPKLTLFNCAWCKVENISTREKASNDISKIIVHKKITLKYIKEFDSSISKDISSKYKIDIDGIRYKIISSLNINNENKLIQLEIEKVI